MHHLQGIPHCPGFHCVCYVHTLLSGDDTQDENEGGEEGNTNTVILAVMCSIAFVLCIVVVVGICYFQQNKQKG